MVVVGSKSGTIGGLIKHFPTEPLQQLFCAQRRMRGRLVKEQFPSDYHLFKSEAVCLTTTWRQTSVTGWSRSHAADLFHTGVQKLVSWFDTCFNSGGSCVER
ncbi:hypothetical protein AVEN_143148-1 [Araneus ventricosus]|uniref:Uncharacterized protein n=1 Tax=Araneus ventricosus TaxID=182803 RepID=A0A4Y2RYC2_ARAVE|nr:hypothetical protein AVEN_84621-1 [Araneus ventricosus]GBN80757.1 hypothetical protein AVEN_143148-1 [Araneus ventricosus]